MACQGNIFGEIFRVPTWTHEWKSQLLKCCSAWDTNIIYHENKLHVNGSLFWCQTLYFSKMDCCQDKKLLIFPGFGKNNSFSSAFWQYLSKALEKLEDRPTLYGPKRAKISCIFLQSVIWPGDVPPWGVQGECLEQQLKTYLVLVLHRTFEIKVQLVRSS